MKVMNENLVFVFFLYIYIHIYNFRPLDNVELMGENQYDWFMYACFWTEPTQQRVDSVWV